MSVQDGQESIQKLYFQLDLAARQRSIQPFLTLQGGLKPYEISSEDVGGKSDPGSTGDTTTDGLNSQAARKKKTEADRWQSNLRTVHDILKKPWVPSKSERQTLRDELAKSLLQRNLSELENKTGSNITSADMPSPTLLSSASSPPPNSSLPSLSMIGDFSTSTAIHANSSNPPYVQDSRDASLPIVSSLATRNLEVKTLNSSSTSLLDDLNFNFNIDDMGAFDPNMHGYESGVLTGGGGGDSRDNPMYYNRDSGYPYSDHYTNRQFSDDVSGGIRYDRGGDTGFSSSNNSGPVTLPDETYKTDFRIFSDQDTGEWSKIYPWNKDIYNRNRELGDREFRPLQREAINSLLSGHDTFVLIPTGGGKSRVYQVSSLITEGITVVFSPLVALIQDQLEPLKAWSIPAARLEKINEIESDAMSGRLKLLFLTPEKFALDQTKSFLRRLGQNNLLSFFVVDEAHCVTQWGHEFREKYLELTQLKLMFPSVPILAMTATATYEALKATIRTLRLQNTQVFRSSFNREKLYYEVVPKVKNRIAEEIASYIREYHRKHSGIVYVFSQAEAEDLSEELSKKGVKSVPYHAGLSDSVRVTSQKSWKTDESQVIVATIAFGMGIDKHDVRFVIHTSMAASTEGYYQESGRAGRDREKADCRVYFSDEDRYRVAGLKAKGDGKSAELTPAVKARLLHKILTQALMCHDYVTCRRVAMLEYFGETLDPVVCGKRCDNCNYIDRSFQIDATPFALAILRLLEAGTTAPGTKTTHGLTALTGACIGATSKVSSKERRGVVNMVHTSRVVYRTDLRDVFLGDKLTQGSTAARRKKRELFESAVASTDFAGYGAKHRLFEGIPDLIPKVDFTKSHFDALITRMASLGLVSEYLERVQDRPVYHIGLGDRAQIEKLRADAASWTIPSQLSQRRSTTPRRYLCGALAPHVPDYSGYDEVTGLMPNDKLRVIISTRLKDGATTTSRARSSSKAQKKGESKIAVSPPPVEVEMKRSLSIERASSLRGSLTAESSLQSLKQVSLAKFTTPPSRSPSGSGSSITGILDDLTSSLALYTPDTRGVIETPALGTKRKTPVTSTIVDEDELISGYHDIFATLNAQTPQVEQISQSKPRGRKQATTPVVSLGDQQALEVTRSKSVSGVRPPTTLPSAPTILNSGGSSSSSSSSKSSSANSVDQTSMPALLPLRQRLAARASAAAETAVVAGAGTVGTAGTAGAAGVGDSDVEVRFAQVARRPSGSMTDGVVPYQSPSLDSLTVLQHIQPPMPQYLPPQPQSTLHTSTHLVQPHLQMNLAASHVPASEPGDLLPETAREELETLLYDVRKRIVTEKFREEVHVHQVFKNKVIPLIVNSLPLTMLDLADIEGIGLRRTAQFGAYILCCVGDVLRSFPAPGLPVPPPYLSLKTVPEAEAALAPELQKLMKLQGGRLDDGFSIGQTQSLATMPTLVPLGSQSLPIDAAGASTLGSVSIAPRSSWLASNGNGSAPTRNSDTPAGGWIARK